jgi:hypothetical protein
MLPITAYHLLRLIQTVPVANLAYFQLCLFQIHLFFAILYHVLPYEWLESTMRRLDVMFIIVASMPLFYSFAVAVNSLLVYPLVIAMLLAPFASSSTALNVFANVLVAFTMVITTIIAPQALTLLAFHVAANLMSSILASTFYFLAINPKWTLDNPFIDWHDLFHIAISAVYVHRINYMTHLAAAIMA